MKLDLPVKSVLFSSQSGKMVIRKVFFLFEIVALIISGDSKVSNFVLRKRHGFCCLNLENKEIMCFPPPK